MKHPTLYKLVSDGTLQQWWIECDIDRYRMLHCVLGGEVVASEWTYAKPKNVGRSNETTAEQQCQLEITSKYTKKQNEGKYTADIRRVGEAKASYFSPMLAEKFDPDRINRSFYIQPKLNGVRCIANKDGLWSRKGKEFVNTPHIHEALKDFFKDYPDIVLDGELYNHDYKADFNSLVSSIRKTKPTPATQAEAAKVVQYHLYDIYDYTRMFMAFGARSDLLSSYFSGRLAHEDCLRLTATYRSSDIKTAKGLHERNKANGYEGSIVRLDEAYENKRTYSLMKYKDFKDEEFELADITEGTGNWAGVAKVAWIILPGRPIRSGDFYLDRITGEIHKANAKTVVTAAFERVSKAGIKGEKEYCRKLLEDKAKYIGKECTVVFFELTPDDVPLFPIFHSVRDYEG